MTTDYSNPTVLVGFTTEQVTSNLVPIIQTGARLFIAVNSYKANEHGWGDGLKEVLGKRGIEHLQINLSNQDESSISGLQTIISNYLKKNGLWDKAIGWIFGGGQKFHQIASFLLFLGRSAEGIHDIGLYADPEKRILVRIWRREDGIIENASEKTDVDLSLEEICCAFNHRVETSGNVAKNQEKAEYYETEYKRFVEDRSYRREWLQRFERTAMDEIVSVDEICARIVNEGAAFREQADNAIRDWLPKLSYPCEQQNLNNDSFRSQFVAVTFNKFFDPKIWRKVLYPDRVLPSISNNIGTYDKFASYFEELVIGCVITQLEKSTKIKSKGARVQIYNRNNIRVAEHDVLLVHRDGTLSSLDAKTFAIPKKDFDARLYNLRNTFGRFSRYILVFPWFEEDLDIMPQRLVEMPLECQRFGQSFLVVSSKPDTFFVRFKPGSRKVEICSEWDAGAVRCRNLKSFLNEVAETG